MTDELVVAAAPMPRSTIRVAYDEVRAEAESLPSARVRSFRIDVTHAYAIALHVCPKLASLRSQLAALLGFDVQRFDRLPVYAAAAMCASIEARTTVPSDSDLTRLAKAGFVLRKELLTSARIFVTRGIIDRRALESLHRPSGFMHLAADLMLLGELFAVVWPQVAQRTVITEQDLSDAQAIAYQISARAVGKKRTPAEIRAARDMRDRMFTLFLEAYEDTRIAVQYLRREAKDADQFTPPLVRRKRKSKAKRKTAAQSGAGMVAAESGAGMVVASA